MLSYRCSGKVSSSTIRSYRGYTEARTESVSYDESTTDSWGFQTPGFVSFSASESKTSQSSEDSSEEKLKKLFSEQHGEIVLSEMKCQLYTMKINEFAKATYTDAFQNALRSLHYATTLPEDSPQADSIFRNPSRSILQHFIVKGLGQVFPQYTCWQKSTRFLVKFSKCIITKNSNTFIPWLKNLLLYFDETQNVI